MTFLQRFFLTLSVAFISAIGLTNTAFADARVALVIGNSDYINSPKLRNPANDAVAISAKLTALGFDVTEGHDLTYDDLRDTVRDFARQVKGADLAVFYYAGHGIAVDGENYIVPTDARMNDPIDWEFEVYAISDILRILDRADGPSLVFLDACRDNPMALTLASLGDMGTRSLSTRGLSTISTNTSGTSGSVVAYATEPGKVASDGAGTNSPFTKALLKNIDAVNTDFATVTSLITQDVLAMTNGDQRPRFDLSLTGPLVLNAAVVAPAPPAAPKIAVAPQATPVPTPKATSSTEVETVIFQAALETGDIADYETYLKAFPEGVFAPLAHNAIARIEKERDSAALETSATVVKVPFSQSLAGMITAPLTLSASPMARTMPSSAMTEKSLAFTNTQSRAVQLRLNLSGNNVGAVDGQIGPGTRRGISAWQVQNGFAPSGYLNAVQHDLLVANTQVAYSAHLAANPSALTPPRVQRKTSSGKKRVVRKTTKRKSQSLDSQIGGILTGIAIGAMIKR